MDVFLQPHMNRLNIGGGVLDRLKAKTFGFESILNDLKAEIIEYFRTYNPLSPYLLTIKGQIGQGKTVFMLNLIDELRKSDSFE